LTHLFGLQWMRGAVAGSLPYLVSLKPHGVTDHDKRIDTRCTCLYYAK
jgi:hypothetical protein